MNYLFIVFPVVFLIFSAYFASKCIKKGKKAFATIAAQIACFGFVCLVSAVVPAVVHAAEPASSATAGQSNGTGLIAAAIAMGISAIAGGFAVASSAPAAIGAISENPNISGKVMVYVALGEGIVLFGMIVALMIVFLKT